MVGRAGREFKLLNSRDMAVPSPVPILVVTYGFVIYAFQSSLLLHIILGK